MTPADIVPKPALLFTDIEGSTKLVERDEAAYRSALLIHHTLLRRIAAEHGGLEFFDTGDGLCVAFADPVIAVRAASLMQEGLAVAEWPREIENLRVRMAVHWAEAEFREGQYRGPAMHLTARLLGAANGGQVVCSEAVAREVGEKLPIQRLGTYRLRGFSGTVAVYQQGNASFAPLRAAQARRHNLPQAADAFVGRTAEIAALVELLAPSSSARLVTLIGAGGLGKSRLSLAVAEHLLDAYDHSVLHVPAVTVSDADGLYEGIVKALGSKPEGDSWNQLREALDDTPTLLVLDNLEHLVTEAAVVIGRFMRELPLCRVLATSRMRLGVAGETEFPVPPLGVPAEGEVTLPDIEGSEAVAMFVERVAKIRSEFVLSSENSAGVAAICRRLEGIPLALELAAARARVLSIGELEISLSELPLATDGPLAAALRWSVDMLPPDIRDFLGSLSIFRGGWTARTAGEVAAIQSQSLCLSYLHYLLTCSLVQAAEINNSMRFNMLEPVRQMLEGYFDPETYTELSARHGAHFIALGRRVNVEFGTPDEQKLVQEIESEVSNILAALEREKSDEHRLSSAVHFHEYALSGSCNRALRKILTYQPDEIRDVRTSVLARVCTAAGALDLVINHIEQAAKAYEQAVILFEQCGERFGAAAARFNLATVARKRGDIDYARRIFNELLPCLREMGDESSYATGLLNLAKLECDVGHFSEAEQIQREHLSICLKNGENGQLADCYEGLGEALIGLGRLEEAIGCLGESLNIKIRLRMIAHSYSLLFLVAKAAGELGFAKDSIFFTASSRKVAEKTGIRLSVADVENGEKCIAQASIGLDQASVRELIRQGERAQQENWCERIKKILDKLQFSVRTT